MSKASKLRSAVTYDEGLSSFPQFHSLCFDFLLNDL